MMKLLRKIKIKGKAQSGFTLVEMLMTVLILSMVSAVVAGGLPMAVSAYTSVVNTANAESLLSTSMIRLRDELGTASEVSCGEGIIRYKDSGGCKKRIYFDTYDNCIYIEEDTIREDSGETQINRYPLVSYGADREKLYATFVLDEESGPYQNGILRFSDLSVFREETGEDTKLASSGPFQIRVLTDAVNGD